MGVGIVRSGSRTKRSANGCPGVARQLLLMNREIDVRHVLPSKGVPTLVPVPLNQHLNKQTRALGAQIPQGAHRGGAG